MAHLAVSKGGVPIPLQQLSEGERSLIAMIGDVARRLAIANPRRERPSEAPMVLFIDEIELHLHPALQRTIIGTLQKAFPAAQLIVTTHSPQVLASVPSECVRLLDNFKLVTTTAPVEGRDSNAILKEVFGIDERPAAFAEKIHEAAKLIDAEDFDGARALLAKLEEVVGQHDKDVVHLSSMIAFLEAS